MNKPPEYDYCNLCDHLGTVQHHHIIPKSFRRLSHGGSKLKLYYTPQSGNAKFIQLKTWLEGVTVPLCDTCHKRVHLEFLKYHIDKVKNAKIDRNIPIYSLNEVGLAVEYNEQLNNEMIKQQREWVKDKEEKGAKPSWKTILMVLDSIETNLEEDRIESFEDVIKNE